MTTASSSAPVVPNMERPSFAKVVCGPNRDLRTGDGADRMQIAAAALKPTNAHADPTKTLPSTQITEQTLSHGDDIAIITPANENDPTLPVLKPKRLVQLAAQDVKESGLAHANGTQGQTSKLEAPGRRTEDSPSDALLLAAGPDDIGTQISSESGSFKPPSLDGKSFASATTFALDEKESLRPDDSASVKAVEDEESFSHPGSGLPGSRIGSDTGVRAFHEQLRQISFMDPTRRTAAPQIVGPVPKGVLYVPPQGPGVGVVPNALQPANPGEASTGIPPDPKLLEALDSPRDRIWVLKLEQDIIDFVKDAKESSLNLPQCNSFYRMLAHKIADYYMLGHMVDDSSAAVRLYKTPNCRIPPPLTGITTPSTAASTPPPTAPQMKILRRGVDSAGSVVANGSNMLSKASSENGESSNDDDKKPKLPVTREEREARYEAARLRIMGSAKPSESPEVPKESQGSRSSSVTGKKNRKKLRADSDDDFDSRSAYSNYFTTPYNPEALSPGGYGFPEYVQSPGGSQFASRPYDQHHQLHAMQQMPAQMSNTGAWPHQPYQSVDPNFTWPHNQQNHYELTADFRAMSFQSQVPLQGSPSLPGFNHQYNQQYYGSQQMWQSPSFQTPSVAPQPSPGYSQAMPQASGQVMNMTQDSQPYQFGQLPSQAFPGRTPSKMEHPLPGSYKGKHFNPQSQSFIPGNNSANGSRPFTPQGLSTSNPYFASAFGPAGQLQRQSSTSSSPHQPSSPSVQSRIQSQPMTHPLPQPVFPRQPSPNLPLPAKPGQGPPRPPGQQSGSTLPTNAQRQQDQSVVAKWGTPASLPAKPPPSTELLDGSRPSQLPRPSFGTEGAATRSANGPSSLPPVPQPNGVAIVNGTGQLGKRA